MLRLCVLLAVVALTGCRESITSPLPPPLVPPSQPGERLYIKGVASLLPVGTTMQIRSQSHLDADRYAWSLYGDGAVETMETTEARVIRVTGLRAGPVTVGVVAYDASGALLASGQRHFEVTF